MYDLRSNGITLGAEETAELIIDRDSYCVLRTEKDMCE